MKKAIRYLTYDVMDEQHAWDEHTRSIVRDRLQTTGDYQFLTTMEAEILRAWCCLLVDDHRPEMIQYVLDHIDQSLTKGLESERKPGVPSAPVLVRSGLKALDDACQAVHTDRFFHLDTEQKKLLMTEICAGEATPHEVWKGVPQKEFFKKLLTLSIEAYYSHPKVWSEIGYGGPAYPRGYVRMERLDPWEPKEDVRKDEA
ncbi:gluconate 2-dehydrogenase subunit 3 family protein [Paenibacillus sp. P25]|nr:gluconate 2-dehydrogenase subunit 3 family protein [Paenibacillus sp. P25]